MGVLVEGGKGSIDHRSPPRIITHSTTSLTSFDERHPNHRRHFSYGTSLRNLAIDGQIRTGDLELRKWMYRDTLFYNIWLSFLFLLLRRGFPAWEAELALYRAVAVFFFSYLLGILTRSCSIKRWRSARRSHVEVVAIYNHGVSVRLLLLTGDASFHRPSWLLNRPCFLFFLLSFTSCELTLAGLSRI